MTAFTKK
jgi:hypothetical protein